MRSVSSLFILFIIVFVILYLRNSRNGENGSGRRYSGSGPDGIPGTNGEKLGWDQQNHRVYVEDSRSSGSSYTGNAQGYSNEQQGYYGSGSQGRYSAGAQNSYSGTRSGGYNEQKEVAEAIRAGESALESLRNAERKLQSARGWGMVDMFGGNIISGVIKHSRVSEAQSYIDDAKYKLQRFRNELADVQSMNDLDINVGDFLTFADFFFDSFIADIVVQSRISNARAKLQNAIAQVESMLGRLYAMRR